MHPSIRTILNTLVAVLAVLAVLPAGAQGGPKGGSGGVWILPAPMALAHVAEVVGARDLEAARETYLDLPLDNDLVFRLDSTLADQLGAVSVETVQSVLQMDGLFLTVPRTLIQRARSSRAQFIDIVVTNGVVANGIILHVDSEAVDVYIY